VSFQEFTRDLLSDIGGTYQTGFGPFNFEGEFALGFFGSSGLGSVDPDPPWWDFPGLFDTRSFVFTIPTLIPPPQEVPPEPTVFPTVIEPPRGGGTLPSPLEPQVSLFDDILGTVVDVFSGPGGDSQGSFGVLGDIFTRRTTTAQERVLGGSFFEGDIATAIGNIGGALGGLQTFNAPGAPFQLPGVIPVAGILEGLTGGGIGVAPCPAPGGSQGFPAGACITINDWQQLGGPRGFEVAGVSSGGTLILKKKRRRRRRSGLTKGMMTDVDYLARKLGKPAAETYLNRVL
jgi:hypothetical protein